MSDDASTSPSPSPAATSEAVPVILPYTGTNASETVGWGTNARPWDPPVAGERADGKPRGIPAYG